MSRTKSLSIALVFQLIIRVSGLAAGLVTVAVQGRALGSVDFATLSMLLSVAMACQMVADLGLAKVATQRIAADPSLGPSVAGGAMLARLVLGVIGALAGTAIGGFVGGGGEVFLAAFLVCLGLPLSSITVLQALSEARLDVWAVNIIVFSQNAVWLAIVIVLFLLDSNLLWFTGGYALAAVIQAFVVWALAVRGVRIHLKGMGRHARSLLKASIPLGIGAIAVTAYYRLTGVVLFESAGPDESAGYFAAMRLIDAGQAIPATICGVLLPILSSALAAGDLARSRAVWDLALRFQLGVAVGLAAFTSVFSSEILLYLFGSSFDGRGVELRFLILAYPAICLAWIVSSALIAGGELASYSIAVISVSAASLTVLFVAIGRFGAPWAVGVTVATEWVSVGALAFLAATRIRLRIDLGILLRVIALGLSILAANFSVKELGLAAGIGVTAVALPTLSLALGLVTPSSLRGLKGLADKGTESAGSEGPQHV